MSSIEAPPIALFAADKDINCSYARAERIRDEIGDPVVAFYTINDMDHEYFAHANDDEFMKNLTNELTQSFAFKASLALTSIIMSATMLV